MSAEKSSNPPGRKGDIRHLYNVLRSDIFFKEGENMKKQISPFALAFILLAAIMLSFAVYQMWLSPAPSAQFEERLASVLLENNCLSPIGIYHNKIDPAQKKIVCPWQNGQERILAFDGNSIVFETYGASQNWDAVMESQGFVR